MRMRIRESLRPWVRVPGWKTCRIRNTECTFVVLEDGLVQDVLLLTVAEGGVGEPGRQQLFRPGISFILFTIDLF
jgi:hypothetical protein